MAATTIANLTNVLKYVYPDKKMLRSFNRRRIMNAMLEKRTVFTDEGLNFRYNVHTGTTSAGGFIGENDALYDPEAQSNDWLVFNMKSYAHRVQLSGQAKHANKRGKGAVVRLWEYQVNNAVQDARDDFAVENYTPANGILATCQAATSNSVFKVDTVRRLRIGMAVAVAETADDTAVTEGIGDGSRPLAEGTTHRLITAIDTRTRTVTLGGNLGGTPASNWNVISANGNTDHSVYAAKSHRQGYSPYGLEDFISEGNPAGTSVDDYGTVDRTSAGNGWAKGNVIDLNGDNITDDKADEAMDLVMVSGDGETEYWCTTPEIYREIKKLSVGTKRALMTTKIGDQWFPYAELAGKKVYADKFCTPGVIYGIDPQHVFIAETKTAGWEGEDGNTVHALESTWGYQSLFTRMYQLVGLPNAQVKITNVAFINYANVTA